MLIKPVIVTIALMASGVSHLESTTSGATPAVSPGEIAYVSSDRRHVIIFAQDGAHYGPPLEFLPQHPPPATRFLDAGQGVRCVSIGPAENPTNFAIQRPIRMGARFRCLTTSFRVTRCFEACRAAIIERVWRVGATNRTLTSYIYVDSCRGVLVFSENADLARGIPLDAEWLRGEVGILADPHYPECDSY